MPTSASISLLLSPYLLRFLICGHQGSARKTLATVCVPGIKHLIREGIGAYTNVARTGALESMVLDCFLGNDGISKDFLANYHQLPHSALEGSPGTHWGISCPSAPLAATSSRD